MMAERDLSMARYYEKRGENRAAAIYYEQVAKNFADTPLAEQANARVAELATKDPVPKPKAAWLNKVFPDASAVKPLIAAGDNETIFK
jgi:outer membrane protein assembly factor BamD (BamD/ComL family)